MSTTDKKHGLIPVRHLTGGGEIKTNVYKVDSANATAIFKGDVVKAEADGNIAPAAANDGEVVIGVAVGFMDTAGSPLAAGYLPATTAGLVEVVDDPNVIFRVQEDGVGGSIGETGRFATANHVAGAGSTVTGLSGHTIDSSDIGTGAQLKVLDLYPITGNAWGDTYSELLVTFNEHLYKAAVAGV